MGLVEEWFSGGAEQAVVTDLGEAARQDVLKESRDELWGVEGAAIDITGLAVTIAKGDLAVVEVLEPTVDEGDAEDVAGEVQTAAGT